MQASRPRTAAARTPHAHARMLAARVRLVRWWVPLADVCGWHLHAMRAGLRLEHMAMLELLWRGAQVHGQLVTEKIPAELWALLVRCVKP